MCDSAEVSRLPSAPRLNLSHGQPNQATGEEQTVSAPPKAQGPTPVPDHAMAVSDPKAQMMAAWLQMARHVVENTEDVGTGFAREASKMHHGEVPERPIRGQATPEEKEALREEGVEIAEMVLPAFFNKPLQ